MLHNKSGSVIFSVTHWMCTYMKLILLLFMSTARRKHNDSDEDIEKVLAELALEYSGEKPTKDKAESKPEPNEQKIDDEDKKKKGKKDKKKEKAENNDIKDEDVDNDAAISETNNVDMDIEVSTVKTAAQKKKEKKEREKQKKLAQKKVVNRKWNLFTTLICFVCVFFILVLIVKYCNRKL